MSRPVIASRTLIRRAAPGAEGRVEHLRNCGRGSDDLGFGQPPGKMVCFGKVASGPSPRVERAMSRCSGGRFEALRDGRIPKEVGEIS
jgi:hypothetical protein